MKKITALFLSFLMVAMLLPINVWALELEAAGQEDNVSEEVVLEEIIPEDDFTDSAESEQEPLYADTVVASGYCGGEGDGTNLKWTLDGDGVLTISGKGAMADYGRKNMYEGNKAPWGQYIDRLNMLVLENGITNIGVSAFYKCDFMGDLIIPNSVTEIKGAAFEKASFNGKLVLSENLTVINSNAFYWCDFTSNFFIIPESVKTIKSFAFAFEYPAGFIFKGDAPSIRYEWDSDASLPSGSVVWFYKDNDTWELLYDGTWCAYSCVKMIDFGYCGGEDDGSNLIWILLENGELWIRGSGAMEDYNDYDNPAPWIKHKDELKSLSIGEGVTSIGDFAFYECLGFTGDLVIPDSVTTIGGGAFACCSGFDGELVIGKNTEKINEMAFTHCSSLEEKIIVPASVKTIAPEAFTKCGGKNFYFEGDAPNITVNQFDPDAIIYYIADNETWVVENGKWNGYTAVTYSTILSGYCGSEGDGTNLEWVIDINGVLTITGTGKMADYSAVYKGGKYVTTAPWGEYLEKIKMLVIEEGVTSIGEEAFRGCSVFTGDLIIPNSVENIKKRAFYECTGFTGKLVIGTGVTNIGEYAFNNCRGFTGNLVIGNSVKNIEYAAFSGCNKFTGDLVIPDSVISIGNSAFYECYGFKGSLVLGNNVASIGTYAFYRCSFAGDLVMPESITSIGNYAFRNCKINEYYFEGNAPTVKNYSFDVSDDTIYYPKNNATWVIENGKWNGYTAVPCVPAIAGGYCGGEGDGTNLEWVLDAEGVLTISGEGAMKDYGYYVAGVTYNAPWMDHSDEIKTLVIEEGVTTIGKNAFGDCSKITGNLVLPQSIKSIGNYAFMGCTGLTGNLIIPDGVTTIGDWAFYECGGFTGDLIIPDSVTKIGEWAFRYCSGFDGKLVISKNITVLESDVFNGCKGFVGDIVIPEGVTTIEGWAFSGCFGFDGKLVIPDTVTTIGMWAFSSCRNIDGDIIIPDSVVSIGNSAFQNCYGLSGKVVLGKNLESLGQQVFLYCGMDEFYFTGDAPSAIADGMNYQTFETAKDTIYYPKNNATWVIENGKWNGYTAMTWDPCLGADDYEHDFGEWYVFEEATCTEKGEERSDCDNCDRYETREIAAKGHDYKSVVTEPTCTEQGYTTHICACGESYTGNYTSAKGHSTVTTGYAAPTCTESGYSGDVICEVCEIAVSSGEVIPASGHNYVDGICEICGTSKKPYQRITYFTVEVEAENGKTYSDNAVLYLPENYSIDGESVKLVIYCKQGSSAITGSSNPIEAVGFYNYLINLGYAVMGVDGVPDVWCSELGLDNTRVVGNPIAVQGTEKAYNYVIDNYNISAEGCFISGYSQGGHYAQNVIDLTDIPILAAAEQSPVCSIRYHQWDLNASVTVNSVKFTKAARLNIARIYGFPSVLTNDELLTLKYDAELVDAYDPWVRNSENAYTGFVQKSNLWYLPDGTDIDDITMKKTVKCPVKIWCAEDDAALSADVMKVFVKAVQNSGGIAEISVAESGGHGFFQKQAAVGTFVENGKKYNTLPIAVEIAEWFERFGGYSCIHTEIIDKAVEPTCTETGLTEGKHCSACGEILVAQTIVKEKGHSYEAAVTEPTCTEQGYTTHTCSSCGDSYVDSYVEAAGHSFGEWYETKAPTATKKGEERRDCENCDCCETREVEALGGEGAVYGDVNGDGKVNVFDANYIRRFAARILELSEKQLAVSDVNGDGKVNIMDANLIRRFAAKLIDKFPVEG